MLSTVVLPAPFGPIRLVTAPGFASSAMSCAARTPPKANAEVLHRKGGVCAAINVVCRSSKPWRPTLRQQAQRRSPPGLRREPQHEQQQGRRRTAGRYSASAARNSGSSTTIAGADQRPGGEAAPPIITTSTNRIDCENAKVDGRDEAGERGEQRAGDSRAQRRDGEGGGLDPHRREADRLAATSRLDLLAWLYRN
jgi:hypothetical protein